MQAKMQRVDMHTDSRFGMSLQIALTERGWMVQSAVRDKNVFHRRRFSMERFLAGELLWIDPNHQTRYNNGFLHTHFQMALPHDVYLRAYTRQYKLPGSWMQYLSVNG